MRIALLMNLAPRKLGSFEAWVTEMCREAAARGHLLHLFGKNPVHPEFARSLEQLGTSWSDVDELGRKPFDSIALLRRFDVLHLNMFAPRSLTAMLAYAAYPARVLLVERAGGLAAGIPLEGGPLVNLLRQGADRLTTIRVNAIAGVSSFVGERARARFHLEPSRVRTIYNGVDTERFLPAGRNVCRNGYRIVTTAHLIPEKGIDYLLQAFALIGRRDARLTIAGDGPEARSLISLAAALGLGEQVDFVGLSNDIPRLLREADVYVHPTLSEAFGLAVAEAMACGLPVIASRVGGIPELIEDGVSGLLVEPRDTRAIARAIDSLLSAPELRERLGRAARAKVIERFDVRTCAREHLIWCEEANGRRGPIARACAPAVSPPSAAEAESFSELSGDLRCAKPPIRPPAEPRSSPSASSGSPAHRPPQSPP
jgi:glycosyltransferase involved in cell wall biosynthesis